MQLSNLEIVLIFVSVSETILSAYLCSRHKKKLKIQANLLKELQAEYEAKRNEYEQLIEALPIGRNLL